MHAAQTRFALSSSHLVRARTARKPTAARPMLRGLAFAVPASLLAWGVILTPLAFAYAGLR